MTGFTSLDGVRIAYRREGKGPPLLLVHGSGTDGARWQPVMPALTVLFTVYAIDRRGHGASGDRASYRIDDDYDDISACAQAVANRPIDVAAHSYGALGALGAARRGAPIRKLVLFEPPIPTYPEAYYPFDLIAKMRAHIARGDRDAAMAAFATGVFKTTSEELAEMRNLSMWQEMMRNVQNVYRELETVDRFEFLKDDYRDWSIPTLLLLGGESPPQYRATIEKLHSVLPGSRIAVLRGQQHSAMNTAPALFAQTMIDFLQDAD